MEDFMFIFIGGEDKLLQLSPAEMESHMGKWFSWVGEMTERGQYKGGHPLKHEGRGIAGKNKVVTDGPFSELKDLIGGYMIICAENLDRAVEIGKDCPVFEFDGKVEIRPINPLEGQ